MPLPKLPTKPATLLLAKDYPQATGQRPVSAIAAVAEAPAPAPKKAPVKAVVAKTKSVAPAAPAVAVVASGSHLKNIWRNPPIGAARLPVRNREALGPDGVDAG